MPEDTLDSRRREQLVAEVRTLRRELADCTRDGQRLSRLLAEEEDATEALETALHALVGDCPVVDGDPEGLTSPYCYYCLADDWDQDRRDVTHRKDCPVVKARALLSKGVPPP